MSESTITTPTTCRTARDCSRVLEALGRADLSPPSRVDLAEVMEQAERVGGSAPATMAWLIQQSEILGKLDADLPGLLLRIVRARQARTGGAGWGFLGGAP